MSCMPKPFIIVLSEKNPCIFRAHAAIVSLSDLSVVFSTVEGLLQRAIDGLQQQQVVRRVSLTTSTY